MSGLPLLRAVWRSAVIGIRAFKPNGLISCSELQRTLLRSGLPCRAVHVTPNVSNVKNPAQPVEEELSPFTKLIEAMGFTGPLKYSKWKIKIAGLRMYTCCVERIDYDELFERCNLSDTLNSWFLIAQLHVWMALVRMKQEGREGKYMCKYIVHSMWEDLEQRGKVMGMLPDLLSFSSNFCFYHYNNLLGERQQKCFRFRIFFRTSHPREMILICSCITIFGAHCQSYISRLNYQLTSGLRYSLISPPGSSTDFRLLQANQGTNSGLWFCI